MHVAQVEIEALAAHVLRRYTLEPEPYEDPRIVCLQPTGTMVPGVRMPVRARA